MERSVNIGLTGEPADCGRSEQNNNYRPASSIESVLTDAALNELKKQSANGCMLCALEAWEAEDWD